MICCFYAFHKDSQDDKTAIICHHTVLLTIFPCVRSLLLSFFVAGTSCLLLVFTYFTRAPHNPCFLATTNLFFVSMSVSVLFVSIPHISDVMQYLFFSVWLILVSVTLSRSIHVISNSKILFFFYGWEIFHHLCVSVCIPRLLNLFICW